MPNGFSKEEVVAFENLLEGFQDGLVISKAANIYNTDATMMARTDNVIWRPMPYVSTTIDGTAGNSISATGFKDYTQLSVPAQINTTRTASFQLTAMDLRDAVQEGRLYDAAKQKLASDVNVALLAAASQGSLFVKRTSAATGFDDVAQCDQIFNEQGVPAWDRYLALSTKDYNGMASNIASGGVNQARSFGGTKSNNAYERAFVGIVCGFETLKLDYATRKTAAAGGAGLVINTLANGGNIANGLNGLPPTSTTTSANGLVKINVDNRVQQVTITGVQAAGVVAGDYFTIANLEACHQITKTGTGSLKTFRVVSVDGANTATISPPIISAQGGSQAELMYQNCINNTPANNAAIVFLNTVTNFVNPFWQKDCLEILPGRLVVPSAAGVATMQAATDNGLQLTATKFFDINTNTEKFRVDCLFGVVNKNPQMSGVMMFSQ